MFNDSSTNNFEVTANGDTTLSTDIKKYGNASAYFDGDGDYLQTTINDWNVGVNGEPFTIEFWLYMASDAGLQVFISKHGGAQTWNSTNGINFNFYYGSNELYFQYYGSGGTQTVQSTVTLPINEWIHLAVVYDGSTTKTYVDGAVSGTGSNAYDAVTSAFTFEIGSQCGGNYPMHGYIDDLRITKGIARYTSNFTPPTTELPDPSDPHGANVSLLLHMDGTNGSTAFTDHSQNNFTVTAGGDAQISTAEKKFGTGSALFDGTGDYLELPLSSAFDFGSDNFTIECWFYTSSTNWQTILARWGGSANVFFIGVDQDAQGVEVYINGSSVLNGPVNLSAWNHVAFVRNGTSLKLFLNGIEEDSYNIGYTAIDTTDAQLRIGADNDVNNKFNGYIDEVRITKGVARYTANFVPQTAPFANPTV